MRGTTVTNPALSASTVRLNELVRGRRGVTADTQFAKHYWPDEDAIGKRLQVGADKTWVQVVGIAKNSKYLFIAEPPRDFVYLPHRQGQPRRMVMFARSSGEASALTGPRREVVHGLDPNLPIFNVRTMADFYRMSAVSVFNVLVTVVTGIGAMGLGLALVGLYGLVAYAASRRTREIGVRMAIGAERATVVRLMLRQGVALALVGLAIGLVASVAAGRLMVAAFPTGDNPRDLMAQLLVIPIVLAVTFVAPTFRRSRRRASIQARRYAKNSVSRSQRLRWPLFAGVTTVATWAANRRQRQRAGARCHRSPMRRPDGRGSAWRCVIFVRI